MVSFLLAGIPVPYLSSLLLCYRMWMLPTWSRWTWKPRWTALTMRSTSWGSSMKRWGSPSCEAAGWLGVTVLTQDSLLPFGEWLLSGVLLGKGWREMRDLIQTFSKPDAVLYKARCLIQSLKSSQRVCGIEFIVSYHFSGEVDWLHSFPSNTLSTLYLSHGILMVLREQ